MVEKIKNALGLAQGYSGCLRCGDTWNWKARHPTYFNSHEACFPLCQECWKVLTPETRWPYYAKLIVEWENEGRSMPKGEEELIKAAVFSGG